MFPVKKNKFVPIFESSLHSFVKNITPFIRFFIVICQYRKETPRFWKQSSSDLTVQRKSLLLEKRSENDEVCLSVAVRKIMTEKKSYDRFIIAEGNRFVKYAEAIFGWKYVLLTQSAKRVCKTCCSFLTNARRRRIERLKTGKYPGLATREEAVGQRCLDINYSALSELLGLGDNELELIYAHFTDDIDEASYFILVDHLWKSVVLSIRGSISLEDFVVDATFEPQGLDEIGVECGFDGIGEFCHSGFLARSKWIHRDLRR